MMDKKMFLQGHLDKKETCFIASDEMFDQYMLTQKQYEEQLLLESREAVKPASATDDKVTKVLQEGRDYIAVIRKCNDEIPGEEMSEKLDKLEQLVTRIFARVEEEPALASDMQKMLNYYLPTTQKLLEAYRDLDKQDVQVQNISETRREIEKSVDTINMACEGILNDLFRDRAWDIQSDISVLTTMLKQDGYLKSDFNTVEKEN
jgi:5-bromo-4-chloroindolyl phosphate hydrolysis protein